MLLYIIDFALSLVLVLLFSFVNDLGGFCLAFICMTISALCLTYLTHKEEETY